MSDLVVHARRFAWLAIALALLAILLAILSGVIFLSGSTGQHGTPVTHTVSRAYVRPLNRPADPITHSKACSAKLAKAAAKHKIAKAKAHKADRTTCYLQAARGKPKSHKVSTAQLRRMGAPAGAIAASVAYSHSCGPIPNPTHCTLGPVKETSDWNGECTIHAFGGCSTWHWRMDFKFFHDQTAVWSYGPPPKYQYADCNDFGGLGSFAVQRCGWLVDDAHAGGQPNDYITGFESMNQTLTKDFFVWTWHRTATTYAYGTGQLAFVYGTA
jgi:hypothetical protein